MNNDETFEAEVRATLEGMAREPAPDGLVSRVAAIPSQTVAADVAAGRSRPPFRNVISGFAAIAAVLALAVAAVVLRSGEVPDVGTSPSAPVLPSSAATHQASVPTSVPTPVPTSLIILPTPPATPVPTPTGVAGPKVPTGFRPMSVTFVSADEGWVLGSAPCPIGRCPVIAHTLDGGRKWSKIAAPQTTIGTTGQYDANARGVAGLRFADARDGWAFGPDLWATHDGGTTWKRVDPFPGGAILELASSRGTVHAVLYDTVGSTDFRIASAPAGGDAWTVSPLKIPVGGGPVPVMQLVLSGGAGWVLENDRVSVAGARLVGSTWRAWDPACLDATAAAYLAASSAANVVAACDLGVWGPPPAGTAAGGHLYVSHDGGATFVKTGPTMPFTLGQVVATPSTSTIVVAGSIGTSRFLEGSFDGGKTWAAVHNAGTVELSELGFTTTEQGVAITTASSGASHLLMTRDGGHTWSQVTF
jgi:photosystem II stability/assembly factor-like uncharacterized protein